MKNPQLAMSMQQKMRPGHDFCKDMGEGMLTLNQFGENPCVMGKTHQNYQPPFFLSFFPTIYFCQNMVEVVIAWKRKSMGKFELGRAPSFECCVLTSWARKTPRTICQFLSRITFSFGFTFGELQDILLIHHLHSPFM